MPLQVENLLEMYRGCVWGEAGVEPGTAALQAYAILLSYLVPINVCTASPIVFS
jgi:hypothetical protein